MNFFMKAFTVLGLNAVDAASTQVAVSKGLAYELNPFMAWAISHGWIWFWLLKFGVVALGIYLLYRARYYKAAGLAMTASVAVYAWVVLWQLGFWLVHSL
jgi:hypothetical protein